MKRCQAGFRLYMTLAMVAVVAVPALGADSAAGAAPMGATSVMPPWVFQVFDYLVLSMLGLASIAGIALAIDAMLHIREKRIAPAETTEHLRRLIANQEYKALMDFTATDRGFVSQALYAAIRRAHLKYPAMREALDSSVNEQTSDLFRRIEPMNVIGNIGPLLGLLGTVLGMIIAFTKLMEKGANANAYELSGGIGIALWHTFFGLFVAIPCLVVYGFYRTRVDKIATKAGIVAEELLEGLRPDSAGDEVNMKKKSRSLRDESTGGPGEDTGGGLPMPVPQPVEGESS